MLGSHNTFTYGKIRNKWNPVNWILNIWSKCQSISEVEQYEKGVRFFDIRFRPDEKYIRHGLVSYDIEIIRALTWLDIHSKDDDKLFIRFIIEYNKKPENYKEIEKGAIGLVKKWLVWFPNFIYCGLIPKYEDSRILDVGISPFHLELDHNYSMFLKKNWKYLWIPWLYAKINNKHILKENQEILDANYKVLFLDFI